MVDPRINIERRKPFVDMIGPCLAPPFQKLGAVPLAHLLAEPLRPYLAHRQHDVRVRLGLAVLRSEEHTSELQSLMRISYAVFCLKKKKKNKKNRTQVDIISQIHH